MLSPDFREFLEALNDQGAEYLLIGGYAVIIYGHVRATGDFDLWVAATLANSERVVRAIETFFGGENPGLEPGFFADLGQMFIIGRPPARIDVITRIDGLTFDEAFADRVIVDSDGVPISLISLEHLRRNKLASGRNKDLADLDALPEASGSS